MSYDPHFAARIRDALAGQTSETIVEKDMFGGVGFMLNGNMVCGILKEQLVVHVPAEERATLLTRKGAQPFLMRGKAMDRWLLVDPAAVKTAASLSRWIAIGLTHAATLPPKSAAKKKAAGKKTGK